jgi:hypothetical protein
VSSSPFYRVRRGAGRSGIGGERAAVVVRHNGMKAAVSEGNEPGVWWGVMRSRCSGRYGSGGGVRTREMAAAAVDLGKKTTGRGPHVSEGGEGKAGWAVRRPLGLLADQPTRGRGEVGHGWAKRLDGLAGRWAESEGKILF